MSGSHVQVAPPSPAAAAAPAPAPVLIVDDRPGDLAGLAALLTHPEWRVVRAGSGSEALRRILEADFAVILLDVMMPDMDGFEVAKLIRSRERSRHMPIIFLTAALHDVSGLYRGYSVGAVDYLVKPIDEAVVRAKVGIFVELYRKDQRIREQAAALRAAELRELELHREKLTVLSEKRYRNLVEMIPASVWTADPDGHVNYCNHRWYELTGLRLPQTRGRGWLAAVHPQDRERVERGWDDAIKQRAPYLTELRLQRLGGGFRWHLVHAVPDGPGRRRPRGWLGLFADCEALKRAVQMRDEFLSIASHELRTPLTGLLLQLESLSRTIAAARLPAGSPTPDEKLTRKLESAVRQTRRLEALVASLLDVSRIGAGQLQLDLEELDLCELARLCVDPFAEQMQRDGTTLSLDCPAPVVGRWDRLRIEQVIMNLLGNAVKYGGGKPIQVQVFSAGNDAILSVRDHGIGVDPAYQDRIFERFERAVSARVYGGLGMGLYITRHIVEGHGGCVALESAPGRGSTFTVRLPRDLMGQR